MARIISQGSLRQRLPRVEAPAHLKWIRTLPCLITGRRTGIEAAHIRYGDHRYGKRSTGMAEKPDDRWSVPLHHSVHRTGPSAQHGVNERHWWDDRMIDPLMIAEELWRVSGDDDLGFATIRGKRPIKTGD